MKRLLLLPLLPAALALGGCASNTTASARGASRPVAVQASESPQASTSLRHFVQGRGPTFPSRVGNSFFPDSNAPNFSRTSTIGADIYQSPDSAPAATTSNRKDLDSVAVVERR